MDCSPPGSCVYGISQARILEWVAIPLLQEIFPTQGSNLGRPHCGKILYRLSHWGSPCEAMIIDNWLKFQTGESRPWDLSYLLSHLWVLQITVLPQFNLSPEFPKPAYLNTITSLTLEITALLKKKRNHSTLIRWVGCAHIYAKCLPSGLWTK